MVEVNWNAGAFQTFQSVDESVNSGLDSRFQTYQRCLGEVGAYRCSADTMKLMVHCREARCANAEESLSPGILVGSNSLARLKLVDEVRIVYVQLVRADSDDWA